MKYYEELDCKVWSVLLEWQSEKGRIPRKITKLSTLSPGSQFGLGAYNPRTHFLRQHNYWDYLNFLFLCIIITQRKHVACTCCFLILFILLITWSTIISNTTPSEFPVTTAYLHFGFHFIPIALYCISFKLPIVNFSSILVLLYVIWFTFLHFSRLIFFENLKNFLTELEDSSVSHTVHDLPQYFSITFKTI